jgi:hypothetical protein
VEQAIRLHRFAVTSGLYRELQSGAEMLTCAGTVVSEIHPPS